MSMIELADPKAKGPSLLIQGAVLLVMTLAAVGLGWVSGQYLYRDQDTKTEEAASHDGRAAEKPAEAEAHRVEVKLAPLTTNLAVPNDMWLRMEASIVLDGPAPQTLADDIHQDFLAYLRTLRVYQIEGATGLRNLKADLEDRARIRSDGHVKQVLIQTLLFE
ncbi:flagellar FliL protein [Mesorhizobium soli]|uniref:flagellar basal body-associated FliL family protein n=1 Tax=Pseudaminobacter soli (ex Li et al. 2025) TaxID=1295366 RepID=UPI0024743FD6|nr:flagellar basal body-associated FliL family protein [Mesorhizobium soli]MDH6233378.1 flagellar FliL protein [Mesorhizobium soli]